MTFTITNKQKLPNSEFEIEGEITKEGVIKFREQALKDLGTSVKVDGFRPGHIPEKILIDKVGELTITEEAGRLALEHHYGEIISVAEIKAVGSPAVTITKVAPNEAFGFKIKTAVMPEVKLGDYKKAAEKIAEKKVEVVVDNKEVDDSIEELRKQVAHQEYHKNNPDNHAHGHKHGENEDEEAEGSDENHEGHDHAENHDHGDLPLPELNEDFIKKFGDFKTVEDFRAKVKEGITAEKTRKEKDKKRISLMDELIKDSAIEMPQMLVDSELNKMISEMEANISQMGLSFEEYLKHIGKTVEDIKKDLHGDAVKRAQTQLILNKIAIEEKIEVNEDELKKEVDALLNYYKDADRTRATIYLETVMLNEAVWKFLLGEEK